MLPRRSGWVTDAEMEALSQFTIVIQRIARQTVDQAYFPVPDIVTISTYDERTEGTGFPHMDQRCVPVYHNCNSDVQLIVGQIAVPVNAYGQVVVLKHRGDSINPSDQKRAKPR